MVDLVRPHSATKASARRLKPDHPTLARKYDLCPDKGDSDNGDKAAIEQTFSDLFINIKNQIRKRRYSIRTVQELLGHSDVSTTMIYTHVLNSPGILVRSPLDMG